MAEILRFVDHFYKSAVEYIQKRFADKMLFVQPGSLYDLFDDLFFVALFFLFHPNILDKKSPDNKTVAQRPDACFMLAVSLGALPDADTSPEIKVPGADSPYLPGVGGASFRAPECAGAYPPQPEYSFNVSPHETSYGSIVL